LPEGITRSVVFVLATTSWIMSIGLNLNPFMRFDGYYLLSDMTGIDNLQPRSFALGRWKLRELLFAPRSPCPETLSAATRSWLIAYAWVTWLYRLVIFTGIALLVYHYFFKALGIVLFAVEIWFFIALPVVNEVREWRRSSFQNISRRRILVSSCILASLVLLFVFPWSQAVYLPAVIEASDTVRIFPPRPARLETVHVEAGQVVEKGALLVQLSAPDIDSEILRTEIELNGTRLRLARTMSDLRDKEQRLVLLHEFDTLQTKLEGLKKEKEELAVRAPAQGTILELDKKLHPGRWISKDALIAVIGAQTSFAARGYLAEEDVARIKVGAEGVFVPDDILRPTYPVKVANISQSGSSAIEIPALASEYGGRIGVQPDPSGRLVPVQSQFLLELAALGPAEGKREQEVRGLVKLDGEPRSFAGRVWRQVARVLVRESGF
jgi:putative peptide zinc metalloprotease protein